APSSHRSGSRPAASSDDHHPHHWKQCVPYRRRRASTRSPNRKNRIGPAGTPGTVTQPPPISSGPAVLPPAPPDPASCPPDPELPPAPPASAPPSGPEPGPPPEPPEPDEPPAPPLAPLQTSFIPIGCGTQP